MNNGFIVLYRSLIDWEWYSDANTFRLFIHCLLRANHKEKKWQGITIERGSFVTSYGHLASELKLTVSQVRTSLNKLKITGEIAHKSHSKYGIITIKNYDKFQDIRSQDDNQIAIKSQSNRNKQQRNKETKKQISNKRERHGDHVQLTQEQYDKLLVDYGEPLVTSMIDRMNEYIGIKGGSYKDYNLALRKWIREETSKNPKWLAELKQEQQRHDEKVFEAKRDANTVKDLFNKL